jgi:predicted Zn-dependent protease
MVEPFRSTPCRWPAAALSLILAAALAVAPVSSTAQFDNLPKLGAASGDELSAAAERRLGETIMRQIRRDAAYLDDAELVDYLNQLAQPLLAAPAAGGLSFELFAIDDPAINAFALPGGFIGVHVGLLIAAETESEVASVLAHEIGHVTQRHIARMLAQQKQASVVSVAAMALALLAARSSPQAAIGGMMLGDQVARQNMLAFSRDAEREADRVGFEILRQSDFDLQGMVSFFNRLQQSSRFYESNAPAYLRTHPVTGERIADLQGRLQNTRYRQRTDSLNFQLLRARFRVTGDESTDGQGWAAAWPNSWCAPVPRPVLHPGLRWPASQRRSATGRASIPRLHRPEPRTAPIILISSDLPPVRNWLREMLPAQPIWHERGSIDFRMREGFGGSTVSR